MRAKLSPVRRISLIARACTATALLTAIPAAASAQTSAAIPVVVVDGKGHGHGVGMAQDGAYAMGLAGATTKEILGQFYPGTTIGKAAGNVRIPVLAANNVELTFPDGGEIRGYPASANPPGVTLPLKFAPGAKALLYRDGEATRVKSIAATSPPPTTTSSSTSTSSTTSTTAPVTTTTRGLFPPKASDKQDAPKVALTTTTVAPSTTTTAPAPVALVSGTLTAVSTGDGRVGVTPRNHRYRGTIEMTPTGGGLRFVNQVNVETYLKGMGEVRNPKWPAASLQAQATAARTYAMRAMAAGGELCDTQRCQVYLGADAEYAEMNRAVLATAGQVLMFGKAMASAVYSANGGGHSATRAEGFGVTTASLPYLRAAPYLSDNVDNWHVTISLRDVARHLNYRGEITSVEVVERGPSGRATKIALRGNKGDVTVSGLQFDSALGLRSTLFQVRVTTATKVETLKGGSMLQAPPEEAAKVVASEVAGDGVEAARPEFPPLTPIDGSPGTGVVGGFAGVLLLAVAAATAKARRRVRGSVHLELS